MADVDTDFLSDPVASAYEPIAAKVKSLSWRQFEELVAALLREAGFVDVQRLTSGSQQGKDIIATWPSRFYLGTTTRFRIQVKHKPKRGYLTKSEIGDSIADFVSQHSDEVLFIITNGKLANDLLEQIDRLLEQGFAVHPLAGNRFIRFLAALGRAAREKVGVEDAEREALHHIFEVRDWVEQVCTPKRLRFSFYRYWTEPYTWFFYRDSSGKILRRWTTSGGEFRLSCFNPHRELQQIGRTVLKVSRREELPEFGVINSTPKGWHAIKHVTVALTRNLGEFVLNDEANQMLAPGGCFSCLVDFKPVDPGIYHIRVSAEGTGGNQTVRENEEFTIVSLGDLDVWRGCKDYILARESWPAGIALVDALFNLSSETVRRVMIRACGAPVSAWLELLDEKLFVSLRCCRDRRSIEEIARFPLNTRNDALLMRICSSGSTRAVEKELHIDCFDSRRWFEEQADPTGARGITSRAFKLLKARRPLEDVMEAVEKASERTPQRAESAADYACMCYKLGFKGFALFYLTTAYYNAPYLPAIAGLYCGLLSKLGKLLPDEKWMKASFSCAAAVSDYERIRDYVLAHESFPLCHGEAALAPFEKDEDFTERRRHGRW
jgi:Restriction endonuclease